LGLHAPATIAATAGFAAVESVLLRGVRVRMRMLVNVIVLRVLVLVHRTVATAAGWRVTGKLGTSAISHGDE
jgi:hypothetical protein